MCDSRHSGLGANVGLDVLHLLTGWMKCRAPRSLVSFPTRECWAGISTKLCYHDQLGAEQCAPPALCNLSLGAALGCMLQVHVVQRVTGCAGLSARNPPPPFPFSLHRDNNLTSSWLFFYFSLLFWMACLDHYQVFFNCWHSLVIYWCLIPPKLMTREYLSRVPILPKDLY